MTKLNLSEALLKFKATEIKVVKDSKNSFYANSEYADINNVLRTIQPTLNDLGIVIVQSVSINELGNDVLNTKIFMSHDSKDCMESSVRLIMPQGKENMQTLGACITYARRYGIISMLSLEAIGQDADDDGNRAVGRNTNSKTQKAYNKPLTPAQQFGAKVVSMKKDLDMARAEGDIDKATRIYEEAGDKGLIQVQDYHARLFENPVATL
tara:strand:+ start:81 stop:710 length:630 start_codon:yes stop_codon:yes gene_type:complete